MELNQKVYEQLLAKNAIQKGHFRLTSGRHSDTYVQCARVFEDPVLTTELVSELIDQLDFKDKVDEVLAPAVGGIVFGYAVAQALGKRFIFAERKDGELTLRRSFNINPGKKYLLTEDVVTTGGSVAELVRIVEEGGGEVIGIVSLISRTEENPFAYPFVPLLTLSVQSWDEAECWLCKENVEIDSPGSRNLST